MFAKVIHFYGKVKHVTKSPVVDVLVMEVFQGGQDKLFQHVIFTRFTFHCRIVNN